MERRIFRRGIVGIDFGCVGMEARVGGKNEGGVLGGTPWGLFGCSPELRDFFPVGDGSRKKTHNVGRKPWEREGAGGILLRHS